MKENAILITMALLLTVSCSDSLIEEHIGGSWELKVYLRNEVDETAQVFIADYLETYSVDGTYLREYMDGKQSLIRDTGTFEINEDQRSIHISGVSSIADFSDLHSTLSTSVVDVHTLDDSEYIYSFENGGDTHEFRFVRTE